MTDIVICPSWPVSYGYNSHVKTVSISQAKNTLSALIDGLSSGEAVIITDRGRPVARLNAEATSPAGDADGRLTRLQRAAVISKRPSSPPIPEILQPPPHAQRRADIVQILVDERATGR